MKNWLETKWKEGKVFWGYYLWAGIPTVLIVFSIFGYSKNWFIIGTSHFLGLFILAKYHWFAKDDTKDKEGETK